MLNPVTIETQMLIRKPTTQVFTAFINPEITSKFWFSASTGKWQGVEWTWKKYQLSTPIFVRKIISEPYRVCRRLNILRDYSDEKTNLYPRN